MFDLDQAVRRYTRSVSGNWLRRSAQIAELQDHLYCEIEHLIAQGVAPEDAFQQAMSKLGETTALQQEFGKNKRRFSLLGGLLRLAAERIPRVRLEKHRLAMVAALLVAVVPAVMLYQTGTVAQWTLNVFEACCAASVKVIGMFG